MDDSKFKKGEYEEAVERAKDLLLKGIGMEEISELTHLTYDDIKKVQRKYKEKLDD